MTAEADITAIDDGGVNTAAEVRAALTSVLARADSGEGDPPGGTYDDEFDDASIHGDWTAVDLSGNEASWVEGNNRLSVEGITDSAGYFHALLKAATIPTGTIIETHMRVMAFHTSYPQAGLLFTDGVTEGAGVQTLMGMHIQLSQMQATNRSNFRSRDAFTTGPTIYPNPGSLGLYLRWKYTAANTFDGYVSLDGNSWEQVFASFSDTITPTHVGLWIESWGTATYKPQASFSYFRMTTP